MLTQNSEICAKCKRFNNGCKSPFLLGEGNLKAKVLIVGEAPGQSEDKNGRPFIGQSGQLLYSVLQECGVSQDEVYVTNAVKCATPDENKKPTKSEIKKCYNYLREEIKAINPNIVIACGAVATEGVLKRTGLMKIKNNVFFDEDLSVKVVPCVHPAYVLRNPFAIGDIREAFRIAVNESDTKDYDDSGPDGKYVVSKTKESAIKLLDTLLTKKAFSFDLETTSLNFLCSKILNISFSWKEKFGAVIPWDVVEDNKVVREKLKFLMAKRGILKIAHNIKFDIKHLLKHGVMVNGPFYCTMVADSLMDENNKEHSLNAFVLKHTDMGEYWSELDKFIEKHCRENNLKKGEFHYGMIPRKILFKYAACDADACFRAYVITKKKLEKDSVLEYLENHSMPTMRMLLEMEYRGVKVDRKELKRLMGEYADKIEKTEKEVYKDVQIKKFEENRRVVKVKAIKEKWAASKVLPSRYPDVKDYVEKSLKPGDFSFNMKSTPQLKEILFDQLGVKPFKQTKTKQPSTDAESLEHFSKNYDIPFINNLLSHRKLVKFHSTYLVGIYDRSEEDGRIHTSYLQHTVVTGRLASRDPNMQNIPRDADDLKKCFLADEGFTFIKADLAQAEFRVWAHYSNDKKMIADISDGLDIHKMTASTVFGISMDDVTKPQRDQAKGGTFGMMYGIGPARMSAQYGISIEDANRIKAVFAAKYPIAVSWLKKQIEIAHSRKEVRSWLGRLRRLPTIDSEVNDEVAEAERQAMNSPIQELASSMNNKYMIDSLSQMRKEKIKCYPAATVHDANFIQVQDTKVDECVDIMRHIVETSFPTFRCKMELDIEIGKTFKVKKVA